MIAMSFAQVATVNGNPQMLRIAVALAEAMLARNRNFAAVTAVHLANALPRVLNGESAIPSELVDQGYLAIVLLTPGEVVMVVHELDLRCAEHGDHFARDPLATGICVLTGEIHQTPIVVSSRFSDVEQHLALGHSLAPCLALSQREERRRETQDGSPPPRG